MSQKLQLLPTSESTPAPARVGQGLTTQEVVDDVLRGIVGVKWVRQHLAHREAGCLRLGRGKLLWDEATLRRYLAEHYLQGTS